jgi:hypothetical protein
VKNIERTKPDYWLYFFCPSFYFYSCMFPIIRVYSILKGIFVDVELGNLREEIEGDGWRFGEMA